MKSKKWWSGQVVLSVVYTAVSLFYMLASVFMAEGRTEYRWRDYVSEATADSLIAELIILLSMLIIAFCAILLAKNLYCAVLTALYSAFISFSNYEVLLRDPRQLFPFGNYETIIFACDIWFSLVLALFSISYVLWYLSRRLKKRTN